MIIDLFHLSDPSDLPYDSPISKYISTLMNNQEKMNKLIVL